MYLMYHHHLLLNIRKTDAGGYIGRLSGAEKAGARHVAHTSAYSPSALNSKPLKAAMEEATQSLNDFYHCPPHPTPPRPTTSCTHVALVGDATFFVPRARKVT